MLICPQCQFENPTANKFCQQCGTSLTQNTCADCGAMVPFDEINCQDCDAATGVLWWVIISPESPETSDEPAMTFTAANGYLDLQQRYLLTEPLPPPNELGEQQSKVLDCQPFQLSVLEALVLKNLEDDPAAALDDQAESVWSDSIAALSIPTIAKPYITLNRQFFHVLPTIHNAWLWEGRAVLLLEDRSDYPQLIDAWRNEQTAPPAMQVLQWLYEMVELWQTMEPWQCQQSLLVLNNLRLDVDDQTLCLQRLYFNSVEEPPTLQDLGRIWQVMFSESQKTQIEAVSQLLSDLEANQLTAATLRSQIEAIAQTLQSVAPPVTEDLDDAGDQTSPFLEPPVLTGGKDAALLRPDAIDDEDEDYQSDSDDMPTIVLPMQLFNLEEVGRTDVGRQRDHNEDYFGIETQLVKLESPSGKTVHARNLYILCDGMGGHASGEVASALAVDTIRKYFKEKWQNDPFPALGSQDLPDVATMTEAVLLANKAIYDVNQQNSRSGSGRMGTTLVIVLIQDTEVAVAHVGDSRLYRYTRKRGLEQITVDHEVGQREIQRGVNPEMAYARPDAYQLTQALGPRDEHFVKPDVQFFELSEDMLLLLCSDGLSDNDLLEKHWESHVQPLLSSQMNLDKGVSELIDLANRYNGHDNVSAIAIRAKVRPSLEHLR